MKKLMVLTMLGAVGLAFTTALRLTGRLKIAGDGGPVRVSASRQRSGDAAAGYHYLTTGDYIRSGIPYDLFRLGFGERPDTLLHREGLNADIPYEYTAVRAANGEIVVSPNCFQCHAQVFDGKLIMGLGNSAVDFTDRRSLGTGAAAMADRLIKRDSLKYEAAAAFLASARALSGRLLTEVRGVNPADRLAEILVAHRDPQTLRWSEEPRLAVSGKVIPTDTPPWWLLKKKHAMFYTGFGRGDFGRFLMASNLLTVSDSSEAREVDSHFNDVLAYIYSIQPPQYPYAIDRSLARRGGVVFVEHCSKCHGNYGDAHDDRTSDRTNGAALVRGLRSSPVDKPSTPASADDYPNLLIPESTIGTDSLLNATDYQNAAFVDWFNNSWFAQGDHPARLEPFDGYIAPPLDGIWITAPYLHNGSVPTLEGVLNSKVRPKYWSRDFDHPQYDYSAVGWKYTRENGPRGTAVYNTTLPGYGNYGHTFGDALSERDRKAVIEYLKTL